MYKFLKKTGQCGEKSKNKTGIIRAESTKKGARSLDKICTNEINQYMCIDLKSFFASVECVERGLDPFETRLVVADAERSNTTICLAVTPAMKKLGVKSRCRLYEIPPGIDYIKATPRMKKYIDYSANVYAVYLKYVSKDDIHVYSIDEVFIDIGKYLKMYDTTSVELGERIRRDVLETTGIPAAFGIGTNLFLAKVALDITAKKSRDFFGVLDEESYKKTLWDHKPLTDFWRIGPKTASKFARLGIYTMRDLAHYPKELLYNLLGVDAEIYIDHAWGREPTTIADIKEYKSSSHSKGSGQILPRNYSFDEGLLITKEMTEQLCLELFANDLVASSVTVEIGYGDRRLGGDRGSYRFLSPTSSVEKAELAVCDIYKKTVDKNTPVRKITVVFNNVEKESACQMSFFSDVEKEDKEKDKMKAIIGIKKKYGKNAIFKGRDIAECATLRERNRQIGGHKSGEE